MIDRHLIEHKLRRIEGFLREINLAEIPSYKAFKGDIIKKRFIERNIQLSIEEMIDICKHIVSSLDMPDTETYRECFEKLAVSEIISKKNLEVYKRMIGFRNKLIHAYEGMNEEEIYGIYKRRLNDFHKFVKEIRDYIRKGK